MKKPSLSLAMIVRDVETYIAPCLDSIVPYCDEVIITDTGSKDGTKKVISEHLAKLGVKHEVIDFNVKTHPDFFMLDDPSLEKTYGAPPPFSGEIMLADFGAARQFGWDRCTSDFIIWVDSDDVISGAEHLPKILEQMEAEKIDAAMLEYQYAHDGHGNPTCLLTRERIIRRLNKQGSKWMQPIHEVVCPVGYAKFFPEVKHVHRRQTVAPQTSIPNRNLKVLLRHYAKEKAQKNIDPRTLFYLGMEWRFIDAAKADPYLREYIQLSGWDEERALARRWLGLIHETKEEYEEAFKTYSSSHIEFPYNPESLFGCARTFYFRANEKDKHSQLTGAPRTSHPDWQMCVTLTERGLKISKEEQERFSVLQWNPFDRNYQPLRFYSKALIEVGRVKDGLAAAEQALLLNPQDKEMAQNVKACKAWLEEQAKPKPVGLDFKINEPLDTPPQDLPPYVYVTFAIQLWKSLRQVGDHKMAVRLLESLPEELKGHEKIRKAREMSVVDFSKTPEYKKPVENMPPPPWLAVQRKEDARKVLEEKEQKKLRSLGTVTTVPGFASHESVPAMQPTRIIAAAQGHKNILIWTGAAFERWSPSSIDEGGIGGSETAAYFMARELARLGHRVRVVSDCGSHAGIYGGAEFIDYRSIDNDSKLDCDIFISSRQPGVFDRKFQSKLNLLWVHDVHVGGRTPALEEQLLRVDKILCLSKWHKAFFSGWYPWLHPSLIHVTRNGIDETKYASEPRKIGNKLVYSSSGNRGLDAALDIFPKVRAEVTDAELHVLYGFETWMAYAQSFAKHEIPVIEELKLRLAATPGVTFHGRVNQKTLAKLQLESKVWFYPTNFTETSCITAMECQAAGCVPVTSALAALSETVHHGVLLNPPNNSEEYQRRFVSETIRLLRDEDHRTKIAEAGRREALQRHPWSTVAAEWNNLFDVLLEEKRQKPLQPYGIEKKSA